MLLCCDFLIRQITVQQADRRTAVLVSCDCPLDTMLVLQDTERQSGAMMRGSCVLFLQGSECDCPQSNAGGTDAVCHLCLEPQVDDPQ